MKHAPIPPLSPEELQRAIEHESKEFERTYRWLEQHMPPSFLDEINLEARILITRSLLSFNLQDCFSQIHLKHMALTISMDGPDADLKILKRFSHHALRYYRTFVSNEPFPSQKNISPS